MGADFLRRSRVAVAECRTRHQIGINFAGVPTLERKLGSRQTLIVWIGAALYALSFFLTATSDVHPLEGSNPSTPGWMCAIYALVTPIQLAAGGFPSQGRFGHPIAWAATFVTGCINPMFLATFVNVLRKRQTTVGILRIVLFVMILLCGIVFYMFGMYPREGFLVWVLGMLLVVSSAELGAVRAEA